MEDLPFIGLQYLDILISVVKSGQHVTIAQLLQELLPLLSLHAVDDKVLDGRQQRRIVIVIPWIIHAQKSDDFILLFQRYRQETVHLLLLQHIIGRTALLLIQGRHEVGFILLERRHPYRDDIDRDILQVLDLCVHALADMLIGIFQRFSITDGLKNVASICIEVRVDDTEQLIDRRIGICIGRQRFDTLVQRHRYTETLLHFSLFLQQLIHLKVLFTHRGDKQNGHREPCGHVDQPNTIAEQLNSRRPGRQYNKRQQGKENDLPELLSILQQQ